jgi:hypothetical protein
MDRRREQSRTAQQEQLAQYKEAVAKRVEKLKAAEEEKKAIPVRDANAHATALAEVPFSQPDQPARLHPAVVYQRLIDIALRNINGRTREAVLCWPNCDPSPAAVGALLALADCGAAAHIECDGNDALAAPLGLRALIYPYARTAHRALRHIYVDKDYLSRVQLKHQIRCIRPNEDPVLSDYHKTLTRVRTLTGKARDGKFYPEFLNPCLDEIMPSGPCLGTDARSELLARVRKKTDLSQISRSGLADDPAKARFYLFGMRAADSAETSLKNLDPLDVVFLDLTYPGRNRLGKNWLNRLRMFLAALEARYGQVATVALTEDPWTFDALRFDLLLTGPRRRRSTDAAPSSVVFAQHPDIVVSSDPAPVTYADVKQQEVLSFAGEVESTLRELRSARNAALDLQDGESAEHLRALMGIISRSASLPGSTANLGEYIEQEIGALAAADILAVYRTGGLIRDLQQSHGPWAQTSRSHLLEICRKVEALSANSERLTPMAPLLRDVVSSISRVSSRTAVMFQKDMLADFAAHVLSHDQEIGEIIKGRIENRMLLFLDRAGLDDLEGLSSSERNYIKRLIVVAPSRSTILSLLARPWLPDNVIVLADSNMLASAARDANRLSKYAELVPLKSRMDKFVVKASEAVRRVTNSTFDLDQRVEPVEDADLAPSGIVNLAGTVRPDQPVIRLELDGGQLVLARPGTKLVVQDKSRIIPLFAEVEAKNVDVGDRVCVIGDAFLEMARPLLNIIARAAEEIRDYHQLVVERIQLVPGNNATERLGWIVEKMGLPDVTIQRARYWITLQEQLSAPLHEVVPQAPRDITTFISFMAALSVSESVARRYWTWAVIAQRTSRMRAAISFHDAYRSILVDSYAAQSDNPDRARDIRRLRAAAENFVSVVRSKQEQRGNHAGD